MKIQKIEEIKFPNSVIIRNCLIEKVDTTDLLRELNKQLKKSENIIEQQSHIYKSASSLRPCEIYQNEKIEKYLGNG